MPRVLKRRPNRYWEWIVLNNEGYFDKTADTVYAKFKELQISKQYKVIKYKRCEPNSIFLTLDNETRLKFVLTKKGWVLGGSHIE